MLDIRRREFITLLGGAAAWPLAARAQASRKTYRVGFLGGTSYPEYIRFVEALRAGLQRLGYEEGKNIVIEYRWAGGSYERLRELAAELVGLKVDLLVAPATPSAVAAKQATSKIPIVIIVGDNPGMSRPLAAMQDTAMALRIELVPIEVKTRDEIAAATLRVAAGEAQALVAIEDPLLTSNARQIAGLALQNGVPMIGFRPQAEAGALLEYGVDLAELFSRSASVVDKVLKGASPAGLPIERAVKFEVVVNLRSAKTLGIELPTSLLLRANEVIE